MTFGFGDSEAAFTSNGYLDADHLETVLPLVPRQSFSRARITQGAANGFHPKDKLSGRSFLGAGWTKKLGPWQTATYQMWASRQFKLSQSRYWRSVPWHNIFSKAGDSLICS